MTQIKVNPPPMTERQKTVFRQIRRYLLTREGPSRLLDAGGRRSGKTYSVVTGYIPSFFTSEMEFCFGAVTKKRTSGGWGEIVKYCKGMLKEFGSKGWRFAPAEDGIIESPGGGVWRRLEFINPDAGRGETYDGAIVDEFQLCKQDVVFNFLPTLMTTMGFFAAMCTAPKTFAEWDESKWWINIILADEKERAEKYPEWMVIHHPTTPDDLAFAIQQRDISLRRPPLPYERYLKLGQRQLDELRYTIGDAAYRREILVELIEPSGGRIFPHFSDDHIGEYKYDPRLGGEVIVGLDKGEGNAWTISLFCQKYERSVKLEWAKEPIIETVYRIFAEVATQDQISSKQMLRKIMQSLPTSDVIFFPDPNANQFAADARDYGFMVIDNKVPVFDGNEIVDELFRKRRIEVDASCEVFIKHAKRYSIKQNGQPDDVEVDGADCVRYLIYNDADRSGELDTEDMLMEHEIEARFGEEQSSTVGVLQVR